MVKYSITKEEYDALSPELKAEYRESGPGYKLDVSGIDLKAQDKLETERGKRREAERKEKEAQDALDAFKEGDDRPQLVEKHTRDMAKEKKRADDAEKKYTDKVRKDTLGTTATDLANTLSKQNAKILAPHINSRLDVDMTDPDNPKIIVLDLAGKPTDKKIDDLKAEFLANRDFASIITASQASGGGASKSGGSGPSGLPAGGNNQPNVGRAPNLESLSNADLAQTLAARAEARGRPLPSIDRQQ